MQIINDMLSAIRNKGGRIKQTHLMYKANLSHTLMMKYLKELKGNDLVEKETEGNNKFFLITQKGLDFLEKFEQMNEFKESFGL